MEELIKNLYKSALEHRSIHSCGAVPYQNGKLLTELVINTGAQRILEIGTGVGYSAICLALGNEKAYVETIDKDANHIAIAKENIEKFGLDENVTLYEGKAEEILPKITGPYDLIFYDGFVPQKKFVAEFERLLKTGGILLSTNLFLSVPTGGGYLKLLHEKNWETKVEGDTATSVKL